jgi:hypothetical protein
LKALRAQTIMTSIFLSKEDVATLTGAQFKTKQVEQLRKMRLPFWVNAQGVPVVPRSAIDGRPEVKEAPKLPVWVMPRREPEPQPAARVGVPQRAPVNKKAKAKKP